ncbi:MAG: S8 family serine peptidase [Candidatus Woesearchaeota archaeon]
MEKLSLNFLLKKVGVFLMLFIALLFLVSILSTSSNAYLNVYKDVKEEIDAKGYADVIIVLENDEVMINDASYDMANDGSKDDSVLVSGVTENMSGKISGKISGIGKVKNNVKDDLHVQDLSDVRGFAKRKHLESLNGYSGILDSRGLEELESKGIDATIYYNTVFYVVDDYTLDDVESSIDSSTESSLLSTPLNISTAAVNANYSWNIMNITGRGVKLAIIDTGIDYTHPDLGGCFGYGINSSCKVFDGYDFNNDDTDPIDDMGHGTHVAGIASAEGNITGVAPDAIIYALKACDAAGSCTADNLINAMDWAKNASIDIVSLSLGVWVGDVSEGNSGQMVLSQEVEILNDAGIVVVVSAGNSGPGVSSILAPADAKSAITVGAVDDNGTVNILDDLVWYESGRGPSLIGRLDPELVAPGYGILSTKMDGGYEERIGTSMAAPFVSGAAALLLEQYPSLTPLQVRTILMQSTNNIRGNVFDKGTGELDVMNALIGRVYAVVNHTDTYNVNVADDRWEFVTLPSTTTYANLTIFNDNAYTVSFSVIVEDIISMENNFSINTSQLKISVNTSDIIINASSNYTFQANFSLTDFDSVYASTYAGIIFFNGTADNGTVNVSKSIRIPIVITVPITGNSHIQRTMDTLSHGDGYIILDFPHDDVYQYCHYTPNARNLSVKINWSNVSNDLDLYLYNSTGYIDTLSGNSGTESESVNTSGIDLFRWFRIDGYTLASVPFTFDINLTVGNTPPTLENITDIRGMNNGTLSDPVLLSYRPENITLNISYYDYDLDMVNISVNDSGFILVGNSFNSSSGRGSASFEKTSNYTAPRESTILVTLTDYYGGTISQEVTILVYSSIRIRSQVPSDSQSYLRQNNSMYFMVDAYDIDNKTLYYYWDVNGTLNYTSDISQNFSFDSNGTINDLYTVGLLISSNDTDNDTNETVSWTIYIDASSPSISIDSPTNFTYNTSRIDINYTLSDSLSGVGNCWYVLNSTDAGEGNESNESNESTYSPYTALSSCTNTSIYLPSNQYMLYIYANDSVDNIGYSNITFSVNDTAVPIISNATPSGTLAYTTSVSLSINTDENATCKYDSSDIDFSSMAYTFNNSINNVTYLTSHTASYSVSAEVYILYVRCADLSNNTNNVSANISFTVDSRPRSGGGDTDDEDADDGDTGDGSGSSSYIYYTPEGDESVSGVISEYGVGENGVTLDNDDIAVDGISFDMNSSGTNARFTVTEISNTAYNYTGDVYAYLLVKSENFNSDDLKSAKIFFNVRSDWLILNNISHRDIVLLRYDDILGNWTTLLTEFLNESDNYTYYVAHTPAFGLFAISHNHSNIEDSIGTPPINISRTNKDNQSKVPSVISTQENSGSGNGVSSTSNGVLMKGLIAVKSIPFEVIVLLLFGIAISIISAAIIFYKQSIEEYRDDIVKGTDEELRKLKNVLLEDVISKDAIKDTLHKDLSSKDNIHKDAITKETTQKDAIRKEIISKDINKKKITRIFIKSKRVKTQSKIKKNS